MNNSGVKVCEICGATCGWEPGKGLMVPKDDEREAARRSLAHLTAIVLGTGKRGITMREIAGLMGEPNYDEDDADDRYFSVEAKCA